MATKNVIKKSGCLPKKSKRDLLMMRLYDFKEKLKIRAKNTPCQVVIQDESYTSKTCGRCNHRNKIGVAKVFECKFCDYATDRDVNGARNILRKTLNIF